MDTAPLTQSPEEKSSFRFGLWALLLNLLCGCFPAAIVLGIFAITKHSKAKLAAAAEPERYTVPGSAGMVLGILGMCWTVFALAYVGIISAIAIPALLSQRGRARDKTAILNMTEGEGDLVNQFDKLREAGTALPEIPGRLEAQLRVQHGLAKNPWNPAATAFNYRVMVVQGLDGDGVEQSAVAQAETLGQAVYVIELPGPQQPGYLAGAVRTKLSIKGSEVQSRVSALE